jgi:hypothetical protein
MTMTQQFKFLGNARASSVLVRHGFRCVMRPVLIRLLHYASNNGFLPARRASLVDPIEALRME